MSYQKIEIYINGKNTRIKNIVSVSFDGGKVISFSELLDEYNRIRNYTPDEGEIFELYVDGVKNMNPDVYIKKTNNMEQVISERANKKNISDLKFNFKTLELYSFKCKDDVDGSIYTTFKKSTKEDEWKIQ